MSGYFNRVKNFLTGSKNKNADAIKNVKIAEGSLTERRKDFESLGKRVGKYTKDPAISEEGKIKLRETVQPAAKKISKLHDDKDKITKRNKSSQKLFEAAKGRKELKFGGVSSRKSNVQKIQETFGSKDKVPNKYKGFSKLPEAVQQKINKKLAKKV